MATETKQTAYDILRNAGISQFDAQRAAFQVAEDVSKNVHLNAHDITGAAMQECRNWLGNRYPDLGTRDTRDDNFKVVAKWFVKVVWMNMVEV